MLVYFTMKQCVTGMKTGSSSFVPSAVVFGELQLATSALITESKKIQ